MNQEKIEKNRGLNSVLQVWQEDKKHPQTFKTRHLEAQNRMISLKT